MLSAQYCDSNAPLLTTPMNIASRVIYVFTSFSYSNDVVLCKQVGIHTIWPIMITVDIRRIAVWAASKQRSDFVT